MALSGPRAATLAPRAIVEALEQGRFYSSTGVQLDVLDTTASDIHVVVKATSYSKYRIQFIGQAGRVLAETAASEARAFSLRSPARIPA